MSNSRHALSRRTFIRGAGTCLALPWLEAMTPAYAGPETVKGPTRLGVLFMPNGVREDEWTPSGKGRDFEFSKTLRPLSSFKEQLLIPTNLWNRASDYGDGHYVKTSGFLTCQTIQKSLGFDLNSNGTSMDQVAAQRIGNQTPLPSLELAISPPIGSPTGKTATGLRPSRW